jgi:hypothetical protein
MIIYIMINVNKRMYLTNQHKYILSNQQDTGSMNIKGRTWENNKIQKHFDGTIGDNTAIVFKNLTKSINVPHININLMQFNTFSTQIDIRSLTVSINEGSKGYLSVTYGMGYNSYEEVLISNMPNSITHPENGQCLTITNKFTDLPDPFFGTVILNPKSLDTDQFTCDANSFRGVVTLTYKIANKLSVSDTVATCKVYFLPYPRLRITSIDNNCDFITESSSGSIIYPNPTKFPLSTLKNEVIENTYSVPVIFTNSFDVSESLTYIDSESHITPNQQAILNYINCLLTSHVNIPNYYTFMYFTNGHFKIEWGSTVNTLQNLNIKADKNIYAGKIVIKSNTSICDTHDDIITMLTFDNNQNLGYIKTIFSDVAPLIKVLSIVKSTNSDVSLDLMAPKSNPSNLLNFDQTITVIIKNQSDKDIKIKISETLVQGNDDCSSLYDDNNCSSLYDDNNCSSLYEEKHNHDHCNDELYITDSPEATTQIIKPGNYAVFERILFSPNIWEASGQTKIVLRQPRRKGNCCK